MTELKKLLAVLREKRVRGCEGNGDCGQGHVYLVGTGPGDPEILTLKSCQELFKVPIFCFTTGSSLLELVAPDARLLDVQVIPRITAASGGSSSRVGNTINTSRCCN